MAIHAGIFALVAMLRPPPPPGMRPVEVSVIPVAEEPLVEPTTELPSATPTPVPTPAPGGGARKRATAASQPAPAAATSAEPVATSSDVAVSPESSAPEGAADVGAGSAPGPAGGGVPLPSGTGPVPLADYSQVELAVAPELLNKFAGREIVLDLFVDEEGRVNHSTQIAGVDGRVDTAVAQVSRDFRFIPATDPTGQATTGVVTYRFKVRPSARREPARQPVSPVVAAVGLRGAASASKALPAPDPTEKVEQGPPESSEKVKERRALGRALARGIAGTLFGGGEAVLGPSAGKSGLPKGRRVAQLSRRDKEKFCKWSVMVRGGEGFASEARFPEDRTINDAAGRQRWYEGAANPDGTQVWKPWWWGNGSMDDKNFRGRVQPQENSRDYAVNSGVRAEMEQPDGSIQIHVPRLSTPGTPVGKMEGPERMAVVQSEATCVAELDEVSVCTVTVAEVEACVDAMVLDPALGGETAACTKVSRCGAPMK